MTRQEFVKIRKRRGLQATLTDVHECLKCGANVIDVITRWEAKHFMRFDAGENGQLHECKKASAVAR